MLKSRRPASLRVLQRDPLSSESTGTQFDETALLGSLANHLESEGFVVRPHQDHMLSDYTSRRILLTSRLLNVFDRLYQVHFRAVAKERCIHISVFSTALREVEGGTNRFKLYNEEGGSVSSSASGDRNVRWINASHTGAHGSWSRLSSRRRANSPEVRNILNACLAAGYCKLLLSMCPLALQRRDPSLKLWNSTDLFLQFGHLVHEVRDIDECLALGLSQGRGLGWCFRLRGANNQNVVHMCRRLELGDGP